MKRFTLTMMGLLLLLGGVSLQAQTVNLPIKGGYNWDASDASSHSWKQSDDGVYSDNSSSGPYYSGTVTLRDAASSYNNRIGASCVGGTEWATSFTSGDTHTFTVTLDSEGNDNVTLYIAALSTGITNRFTTTEPIAYTSIDVSSKKVLTLNVTNDYGAVYIYTTTVGGWKNIKVLSITRTITTASSVTSPTISPASGTYDGDLSVTITKGEGNDKVVYSVSGATTGNVTDAEFTADSKPLTLTGTGTITVTAKGVKGTDESSEVTNTYTYDIPSGNTNITENLPHTFNSWDNSITIGSSNFSNIEEGDYVVFGVANVAQNGTVLGFRDSWNESPYSECTTTSGGNGAKGTLNIGDTQWWMKVNSDVVNSLKSHEVRMQGGMVPKETAGTESDVTSSVTLNSLNVYECKALNESSNNLISSKINHVVVELTRSFVANTWNTVCLPFALTSAQATQLFGEGYQLAEFTSVSGSTMEFTTTDDFDAGVPYLVKPTINVSNESPVVLVDIDITAKTPQTVTYGDYSFVGTFTGKTFSGSECAVSRFVATENKLKTPTNNSTMKALRAYFTVPSTSPARSFTIDGFEDDTTTSISEETMVKGETSPNKIYNLAGQRVAQPTKGLYIVNGKKVVLNK